jgi:hypothetical protein
MLRLSLREEITAAVQEEAVRIRREAISVRGGLESKLDACNRASTNANVYAQHAVASAERAEKKAQASAERAERAALASTLAKHSVERIEGRPARPVVIDAPPPNGLDGASSAKPTSTMARDDEPEESPPSA